MSMPSFVPENYVLPTSGGGNFTKLQVGENRLRILSVQPLIVWQYWNTDGKPVRFPLEQRPTNPANIREGEKVKQCWFQAVYNYETKAVEIWEVSQVGIISAIVSYSRHEDYGHPTGYGYTITKAGSGKDTTYTVVAGVPKPLPDSIAELAAKTPINLAAILSGDNPFEALADEDANLPF